MERKPHGRLPTGYVVLQATRGKDRKGQARRGVWLALPVGYVQALGWEPGTVVKVRVVGRHLELHKQEGETPP